MSRFLFVHGSWHGAWCWELVEKRLSAAGHMVRAIDLPGHGEDARNPEDVTLAHYSAAVRAEILDMGGDVILVGHSMGGVVISAASELIPEAISKLVFIAALIPEENDTLVDLTEKHIPEPRLLDQAIRPDGLVGHINTEVAHELFYTDLPEHVARKLIAQLGPQPLMPLMTPIKITSDNFGALPKIYIECTKDMTIPIGAQRAMLRAAKISEVVSLQSAHSPFVSMPDQLVDILKSLENTQAA